MTVFVIITGERKSAKEYSLALRDLLKDKRIVGENLVYQYTTWTIATILTEIDKTTQDRVILISTPEAADLANIKPMIDTIDAMYFRDNKVIVVSPAKPEYLDNIIKNADYHLYTPYEDIYPNFRQ